MRTSSLLAAALIGASATLSSADISGTFALSAGSSITDELTCLPPCLCEYHKWTGPLTGTFFVNPPVHGPVFDEYPLTAVDLTGRINGQAVALQGWGTYTYGGDWVVQHRLTLTVMINGDLVKFDSGIQVANPAWPLPQIRISAHAPVGCGMVAVTLSASPGGISCYPNCDASTSPPMLNVNDFLCFLTRFAQGEPYANCDGSATEPALNVNDFVCFLNSFSAGCS